MSRAMTILELEQQVGVLIRRVRRVIGERAALVHPDLQPSGYLMLTYAAANGPLRASEMCAVFHIDKGAISRQVAQLEDLGFVQRSPDPDDGRATLVSVSSDGLTRLDEIAAARRERLDQHLEDWTDADLARFTGMLGRYNESLEVPDVNPAYAKAKAEAEV